MANKNQWDSKVNDTSLRDEIDNLYEAIPSYVEVDVDDIQEDQRAIAFKLADQLNTLKDFLDAPQKIEPGATYSLSGDEDETWPEDAAAYKQSGPVVLLLLENLKVVEETLDQLFLSLDEGEVDLEQYFLFGKTPSDDILEIIFALKDTAASYLQNFPELNFSLKKEVPPIGPVPGELGPTTIFCDPNLEASLGGVDLTSQSHYIGMLAGEEGVFASRYLPVRLQPRESIPEEAFEQGWDFEDYRIVDDGIYDAFTDDSPNNEQIKNKISAGIKVPLGFEITVVEIVPSKTGTWIGFISDDPRISDIEQILTGTENIPLLSIFSVNQNAIRVLYTKAEYIRIKESALQASGPDPYVSERAYTGDDLAAATSGISGAETIAPADNQNWFKLEPEDVKLQYYDFYAHNLATLGDRTIAGVSDGSGKLFYNHDSFSAYPTLKYSEGYYYFIAGSAPRKTEAELINESTEDLSTSPANLEAAKSSTAAFTSEQIREEAWKNLLKYLGKSDENISSNYVNNLKEKYFIKVAKRVNAQSANPNNEKILFAIPAAYVDSLPTNPRPYKNDFDSTSPFLKGNNYAVQMNMGDIKEIAADLVFTLKALKRKAEDSKTTIENANELIYDFQAQIDIMEEMPDILNEFFNRQSFPSSMNKSLIYDMVREGVETTDRNHIIQIGVKDNAEVGGNVRETISYILFSPNPEKLKDSANTDSNLFYFDPYLTAEEYSGAKEPKRSALPLRIGLPWLREKLEGVYGTRALHLLLSHEKARDPFGSVSLQNNWMEFMSQLIVPPVKIYLSKRLTVDPEEIECDEIIKRLNKAGPTLSLEERLLQEKLYNSPECAEAYYNQFSEATPAVSPGLSKKDLERKAKKTEKGGNILDNQYIKVLYTGFFNSLDTESILALIMACLQKKLGIALTAEAICETAIIKLIETTGVDSVEKAMLANALLTPDSDSSRAFLEAHNSAPKLVPDVGRSIVEKSVENMPVVYKFIPDAEVEDAADPQEGVYELDKSYNAAPIATSMYLSNKRKDAIEAVKSLEKTGVIVDLIPGKRPEGEKEIAIPFGSALSNMIYSDAEGYYVVPETYTNSEIESERSRLKDLGYSTTEIDAALVASGYLTPNPDQYQPLLASGLNTGISTPLGTSGAYSYSATKDARIVEQNAHNWLSYMKRTIGLASICELIVGDVLDGLQNLIRDPGAFFNGGGAGWWDSFVEGLKRQFSPPSPTLKFPDALSTDNHMGDYGEKLLKTILSMVAQMLGQIVNLLLKSALEQCLEEDSDIGTSGRKPKSGPDIPFPVIERANLPKIAGLSASDIVAWMKDLLDNLSTGQLCALLRGDATRPTLQACLSRTKISWQNVYDSGIDTIYEIRVAFKDLGADLDLEICNVIESPALVNNLCEAIYDIDARCAALLQTGLTEEECQDQIDQEIADLKNRVAGLASLSLLDTNSLSNSFPPICGDNGSFVIPPGVKDTMERITDNMLTNVKGSLMIDLAGLKFFSTPPRALLAVSDPEELKKAHQVFLDLAKNPNMKNCLAVISDPRNHFIAGYGMTGGSTLPNPYEVYPLTYGRQLHNGGLSTRGINVSSEIAKILSSNEQELYNFEGNIVTQEEYDNLPPEKQVHYVPGVGTGKAADELSEELFEAAGGVIDKALHPGNFIIKENLKADLTQYAPGPVDALAVLDSEELMPLHVGLLARPNETSLISEKISKALKEDIQQEVSTYTEKQTNTNFDTMNDAIRAEYKKDMKPAVLEHLTVTFEQAVSPPIYTEDWANPNDGGFETEFYEDRGHVYSGNRYGNFPGNSDLYKAGNSLAAFEKQNVPRILKRSWSLDTKLKDIDSRPWTWYYMLRAYTGCDLGFHEVGSDTGTEDHFPQRDFPNGWLARDFFSGEFDPENPKEFYAQEPEFDPYVGNLKGWWQWFIRSPGLRNLVKIGHNIIKQSSDRGPFKRKDKDGDTFEFNLAVAFMELTLAEASGLEYDRIKNIFPNMPDYFSNPATSVVLGTYDNPGVDVLSENLKNIDYDDEDFDIVDENSKILKGASRWGAYEFYYPHFLVFERIFRDSKSPLNAPPQQIIDSFSMDGEKVNKELYSSLNFVPDSMIPAIQRTNTEDFGTMMINDTYDLGPNWNPNILKYELPTVLKSLNLAGAEKTNNQLADAMNTADAGNQLAALADSFETSNSEKSLILQNVSTPLQKNIDSQSAGVKNVSKIIKGVVTAFTEKAYTEDPIETLSGDKTPIPPNIVVDDSRVTNDTYNFNFGTELSPDVHALLESLYPFTGATSSRLIQEYNNLNYDETDLDPLNFKAQIFGQLLTKKLDEKIQEYLPTENTFEADKLDAIKKMLTVEGYSGLQYAYSTQMFAKLKTSRLHNRGFMKKVWKKILKSPLVSNAVDPRCKELFDQMGAPSTQDLEATETDFFNLEEIKPKIIQFYEKSLCQDVYESNETGQDSTRISLLEGMVSLVVKIYTLEMCLASVIAWDSFDMSEAFKDSALISVVIKNISEDFDIDFLSFFATDMLKKEEGLTEIQLAQLRLGDDGSPQSSMEYLISKESESIASIIKSLFVNSFPLSTNLEVSLIKNSDPDFIEEFARQVSNDAETYPAYQYAALAEDYDYATDVRIKDNIYTMNYGSGEKTPYIDALEETEATLNKRAGKVDLFGYERHTGINFKNNKNYFHSLPMNYYHALPAQTVDDVLTYDLWKNGAWKVNVNNQKYAPFKEYNTTQQKLLGFSDPFSFENNSETTHGNSLNQKLGNITFQPYVKIVDWEEDDPDRNFIAEVRSKIDATGQPCDESAVIGTEDLADYKEDIYNHIDKFRTAKNNVFNCEIYGYVPLSAWSYFYNHYFMKAVTTKTGLKELYNQFGLKPFFKTISFGMRMSYSTSYGAASVETGGLTGADERAEIYTNLESAFNATQSDTPLKKAKTILGKRPYHTYSLYDSNVLGEVRHELQIPIVEIEREIKSVENTQSFTVGESDLFPLDEIGYWPGASIENPLTNNNIRHHIKNPHQFYYKNLANGLLQEVKNSPEFKLMYDYLFPMRRYMAMATIMSEDGLSKFISSPTNILDKTKDSLQIIIDNISNSTDYQHLPDPIANLLADRAMRAEAGTGGLEPDMTKEILKIVLRTPLLVLKGFVEITDPAIITAKRIISIANAVQAATLASIKQGAATAKKVMQAGIDAAKQIMQQIEVQISTGVGFAKATMAMLPTIQVDGNSKKLSDYVTMDTEAENIRDWVFKIENPPIDDPSTQAQWDSFKEEFEKFKNLRDEYAKNAKKLEQLERKKRKFEEETRIKIRKAENTMKDIFQSPYLLPGTWAAMFPSVIPFGGGINPFPMPLPFVSTFPGMIYLAILFIDAIEEKRHDDMQKTADPNCEDQL
jgi:hypothetical protein